MTKKLLPKKPLQGRLILDCSTLLPGPLLGKLLVEQGSRVIKIENPDRPDGARAIGEFYSDLNEKKEHLWLNLTRPQDQEKFQELVRQADGLIEGFRPSAKKKLGLDEESLLALNPKLCIASIVGYPEDGPRRDVAGHDLNFQAVTGVLSLFKEMPALPLADLFTAYRGAFELMTLMDSVVRGVRGGGRVSISMSETLLQLQSGLFRDYQKTRVIPKSGETLVTGCFPCYRIYTTSDGREVAIGAIEKKFWERVCEVLGLSQLREHGYATGSEGKRAIDEVQQALVSKPWSHWAPLFANADCCVEAVLDYSEVLNSGL